MYMSRDRVRRMGAGVGKLGQGRTRRTFIAGIMLAGLVLGGAAILPQAVGATGLTAGEAVSAVRGDGRDAPWLRFGLVGLLGLALGGSAVVQYRSSADAPPYRPQPRRRRPRAATTSPPPQAVPAVSEPATEAPHSRLALPAPPPARVINWRADTVAPTALAPYRRQRAGLATSPAPEPRQLSPVERACARAVAAAHRYDRHTTLESFVAALALDPLVKPSVAPTFWDMPVGGHADLARAYLQHGQHLDARSVATMALLTFPHDRELEAILRELAPDRFAATA